MVDRLHGEVEGHELDDGLEAHEGRANADTGEAVFGDWGIDHAAGAEFLKQSLRDLVGALILGDFLAHHEDLVVLAHFLGHGIAQGLAHSRGHHRRIGRELLHHRGGRLVGDDGRRRRSLRSILTALGRGGRLFRHALGVHVGRGGRSAAIGAVGLALAATRGRGRDVLALFGDDGDGRVDGHVLGAVRHENLSQHAFVDRLDFHGRLVGLDLGQHVAGLDRVALLLEPFGELPLFHGRREGGHQNVGRHLRCSIDPGASTVGRLRRGLREECRSKAPTDRARRRGWRNRRIR